MINVTIRRRSYHCFILFCIVLGGVGCGNSSPNTGASSGPSSSTARSDEGQPVDVHQILIRQGFTQGQIGGIESNAGYALYPFGISQVPGGQPTCIFHLTNSTYRTGEALADHPIYSNSTVALTARYVDGDGNRGEFHPEVVKVKLAEVTPNMLAENAGFNLSKCGDITLK